MVLTAAVSPPQSSSPKRKGYKTWNPYPLHGGSSPVTFQSSPEGSYSRNSGSPEVPDGARITRPSPTASNVVVDYSTYAAAVYESVSFIPSHDHDDIVLQSLQSYHLCRLRPEWVDSRPWNVARQMKCPESLNRDCF